MTRPSLVITVAALCLAAAALVLAPASGGAGAVGASTKSVSVRDSVFSPRSVSVSRGGKVVWRWRGELDHNVRFRKVPSGASRRGSATQTSGRFARTFKKRGTYRYVCTIHEALGMKGTVHVG
jgi:plastocyanin